MSTCWNLKLHQQVQEPDLAGVSHILVDEIHERGINEDFLIIILRDLLPRRPDLRLVLMSATLNADLFSKYFGNSPVIHIPVNYLCKLWQHYFLLCNFTTESIDFLFHYFAGFYISCNGIVSRGHNWKNTLQDNSGVW